MKVKKFVGESTSVVMQEVRDVLGRDAIIISNRKTDEGIEILATDDMDALVTEKPAAGNRSAVKTTSVDSKAKKAASTKSSQATGTKKAAGSGKKPKRGKNAEVATVTTTRVVDNSNHVHVADVSSGADVQDQLFELRNLLEGMARTGTLAGIGSTAEINLASRLIATGLSGSLSRKLVESASPVSDVEKARQHALNCVLTLLPVHENDAGNFAGKGGTIILHGGSGAGKTTALCKIAVEFLSVESPSKLAVISHRNGPFRRNGGLLETFGELLQVPVHYTETESDLHQALRSFRRKKLTLVDTDPLEEGATEDELAGSTLVRRNVEHCLVLPASLQSSAIDYQLGCVAETAIQSVVLSRLDETRQPGIAIESLIRSGIKLRACSDNANLNRPLSCQVTAVLDQRIASLDAQPRRSPPDTVSVAELAGISAMDISKPMVDLL